MHTHMTQNCCDLLKIFKVETFNHQIRQLEFFDIYMYSELYLDKFNSNMKKTFFVMGTTLDNLPQIPDQLLQMVTLAWSYMHAVLLSI